MMKHLLFLIYFISSTCLFVQAKEYHVSKDGNDTNNGTEQSPLLTISKAVEYAYPGDIITIHEGVYRERINPVRGGVSMDKPIIYQAAKGQRVEIKGSEIVEKWEKLNDEVWMTEVSNTLFGTFNPYMDTIHGDWLERGKWCHTGEVYLNNEALSETEKLENLFLKDNAQPLWFSLVGKDITTIWANFSCDPNQETVEINVRQSVFYPEKPHINYINVRGLIMSQAATPWAPPTAEQIGLLGTHWSKGWIVENNTISHSKCVGLTLGKYGDEWDNKSESADAFVRTTQNALDNKWDKEHIGSHIVRNNQIFNCGQAGIAGSLGAIYSTIENNVIYDISRNQSFWGYELAGIKFHAPVDVIIKKNHIYRTEGGIWLDWMTQGTRVSGNLLHDNSVQDFSLEVNHGPVLVDNNFFLSEELAQVKLSQGVAFINNLVAWKIWPTEIADERETPYLVPHGTAIVGLHNCPCGDATYLNNIFTRVDLTPYDACALPIEMEGNIFLKESVPSKKETNAYIDSSFEPSIKVIEKLDGWYLQMNVSNAWKDDMKRGIVNSKNIRNALIPQQSFNMENGESIILNKDYLGSKRSKLNSFPGPLEFKKDGLHITKIYSPTKHH